MKDYSQYFEKIDYPYAVQTACIDGRKGRVSGLFPKLPGASLFFPITEWALDPKNDSSILPQEQFKSALERYAQLIVLGVHSDSHHEIDPVESGCGFADKIVDILHTFVDKKEEIWDRLTSVVPALKAREEEWKSVTENLVEKVSQFGQVPQKREFTGAAKEKGAHEMTLLDDHKEEAAIVNYKEDYVLNTDKAVNDGHPVFNLDMWYLKNVLKMAGKSDEFVSKAELFALGAYAATEMVLVENKGKQALRIIINQ